MADYVTLQQLTDASLDCEHIADVATSLAPTSTDRLGNIKKTLSGAIATIAAITDRGAWATATKYVVKDIVSSGGTAYICIMAHTSGATFAGDAANWRAYQSIYASDITADSSLSVQQELDNILADITTAQILAKLLTVDVDDSGINATTINSVPLSSLLRNDVSNVIASDELTLDSASTGDQFTLKMIGTRVTLTSEVGAIEFYNDTSGAPVLAGKLSCDGNGKFLLNSSIIFDEYGVRIPSTAGSVGTYAFLCEPIANATARATGSTVAGSSLQYAGVNDADGLVDYSGNSGVITSGVSPAGTWRLMGGYSNLTANANDYVTSLWVRIA